jgi:hypothetical protein
MPLRRFDAVKEAAREAFAGGDRAKLCGIVVSPLPSPGSLLTVNLHTKPCLVQVPLESHTPDLRRAV